ncbi:hypothetical protein [Halosimplex halobium]|uniref:hypothetical protein n=1 Tax=Halosimplex halobium TaxID=3396618 RepID=UPI003F543805
MPSDQAPTAGEWAIALVFYVGGLVGVIAGPSWQLRATAVPVLLAGGIGILLLMGFVPNGRRAGGGLRAE